VTTLDTTNAVRHEFQVWKKLHIKQTTRLN